VNGETILQMDTYGSAGRKLLGKVSQSIQLNRQAAAANWDSREGLPAPLTTSADDVEHLVSDGLRGARLVKHVDYPLVKC
jgi:hypothetical protein